MPLSELADRLYEIFRDPGFLSMTGQGNEVPLFIQTYEQTDHDGMMRLIDSLIIRLHASGVAIQRVDLFDLVLLELQECGILEDLLRDESAFEREDVLETLRNYSDPKTYLVKRLGPAFENADVQLTLITGSGRIFPFLRTHSILESIQPIMVQHPVTIFFPGQYEQDRTGGSLLKLFGTIPSPTIVNPYYRAKNLAHYRM